MKALLVENNWSTAWEKVSSLPPSRLRLIIVGASPLAWAIAMQNVWLARPLALFKSLWRFASGI